MLPHIVKATLVKLATEDGLMAITPPPEVGEVFDVNLDSIEESAFYNDEKGVAHTKLMIATTDGLCFPFECLKLRGH